MKIKNAIIFGDSYSTFEGYIPEGYYVYYSDSDQSDTDVRKVTQTWWHQVMSATGATLVQNNSWSGSPIGYTCYENSDCSESSSFIYRFNCLAQSGFFRTNDIDTVFVFGGTNDNWCGAPLGQIKYSDWQKEDLYSVLPAITYFLKRVKEELPEASIICIINTELKDEVTECFIDACRHFGAHALRLENIDKACGHPTIKGMSEISRQVLEFIDRN